MEDLVATNTALHDLLDAAFLDAMEATTALHHREAARRWQVYAARLEAHAQLEDRHALPPYAELAEHPRGGSPEIFDNEHAKLGRLVREGLEVLGGLDPEAPDARRQMIETLDRLLLPRHVLEHHTLRENEHLYPTLSRVLSEAQRLDLVSRMSAQRDAWLAEADG